VSVIQQNAVIINVRGIEREGEADEGASGRWV
jgi:hypothetical protein